MPDDAVQRGPTSSPDKEPFVTTPGSNPHPRRRRRLRLLAAASALLTVLAAPVVAAARPDEPA
ncbi:hypothetical protein DRA43_26210, partial [Micromonospora provocatoris]